MDSRLYRACFLFFFVSGFSGLLYQTVWTRLAFAAFGVITPVLSVVVAVFMLGLAGGSWLAGKYASRIGAATKLSALSLYGIAEAVIGLGAIAVPFCFELARQWLLGAGNSDSTVYLVCSALALAAILLPWCLCMGATFPLMMSFLRAVRPDSQKSFSYLYLGNCLGAMIGVITTAFVLIELLGFKTTLLVGAMGNFSIACACVYFGSKFKAPAPAVVEPVEAAASPTELDTRFRRVAMPILFWTGFASMAMEVVWVRAFLYAIGHEVYAFSQLLFVYLLGTCVGSFYYRKNCDRAGQPLALVLALAGGCCLFPLVLNDVLLRCEVARMVASLVSLFGHAQKAETLLPPVSSAIALLSVFPCSALFGYLTPRVIDEFGQGEERAAGPLYAVNTMGCIIGPLVASYLLLPSVGVKTALILLSVPLILAILKEWPLRQPQEKLLAGGLVVALLLTIPSTAYEDVPRRFFDNCQIRRDYAATVVAYGKDFGRRLLVNGNAVTALDQCTKNIGHFPLVALDHKPESALVICFGMGTTYRALLSWNIDVTAVELVPSVVKSFPFFHNNAPELVKQDNSHIIIDDGRRFLARTDKKFDMITIDPSPVMEKGCMSLIFSPEFFDLVKRRLNRGGIFEMFMGYCDQKTMQAVARSMVDSFPHVRMFDARGAGIYCLCSNDPIAIPEDANVLLGKMPPSAVQDLNEWSKGDSDAGRKHLNAILDSEIDVNAMLTGNPGVKVTDDHPYNEYFFLRNTISRLTGSQQPFNPHYLHVRDTSLGR
jgi:spermidine synthase